MAAIQETALYPAIKTFLESQGFDVKGEVRGCDLVAVREGEPPIVAIGELKASLTLELILQGVERLRAADQVWLAVAMTTKGRDRDPRAWRLCRLLGTEGRASAPERVDPTRNSEFLAIRNQLDF